MTQPFNPPQNLPGLSNFAQVHTTPALWRGARPTPDGIGLLAKWGCRTIIDLEEIIYDFNWFEWIVTQHYGLTYKSIPMNPCHIELEDIKTILEMVRDPANGGIMVHCAHGSDRTGVAIGVVRLAIDHWPIADVLAELEAFGWHNMLYPGVKTFLENLPDGL